MKAATIPGLRVAPTCARPQKKCSMRTRVCPRSWRHRSAKVLRSAGSSANSLHGAWPRATKPIGRVSTLTLTTCTGDWRACYRRQGRQEKTIDVPRRRPSWSAAPLQKSVGPRYSGCGARTGGAPKICRSPRAIPFHVQEGGRTQPFSAGTDRAIWLRRIVVLFEVEDANTVNILAVRHQREDDYY
jgi:hypothetical protein